MVQKKRQNRWFNAVLISVVVLVFIAPGNGVWAQTCPENLEHFTFAENTGGNFSIVISSFDSICGLGVCDEIGVFDGDLCVGGAYFTGTTPMGLVAWQDDSQTGAVDGYLSGDPITLKLWRTSGGVEEDLVVNFTTGNGTFGDGAYAMATVSCEESNCNGALQHFTFAEETGGNYSLVIQGFNGLDIPQECDEIAVFDGDLCVGAVVNDGSLPLGLVAWLDDSQTPEVDGYISGNTMSFRFWDHVADVEHDIPPTYIVGNGEFGDGAYSLLFLGSECELSTDILNFSIPNGSLVPLTNVFSVGNSGTSTMTGVPSASYEGYSFSPESYTLEPGEWQEITVTYQPTGCREELFGQPLLDSIDPGSGCEPIQAFVYDDAFYIIESTATTLDFYVDELGQTDFQTTSINNLACGDAGMVVTGNPEFIISDPQFMLQSGENVIGITYNPQDYGDSEFLVTINVEMSDSGGVINGPMTIECIGHGPVPPITPICDLQSYNEAGEPNSPYQNQSVITEGVVYVPPYTYSSSGGGYITDGVCGINFHTFEPMGELQEGDRVRLNGSLWSYDHELYVGNFTYEILENGVPVIPTEYTVSDLAVGYNHVGAFVKVTATAVNVTPESFYLDDGANQILVERRDFTGVSFLDVCEGQPCTVISPCMNVMGTITLSPRRQADLLPVTCGGFVDVTANYPVLAEPENGTSMAWVDYDQDGDSDLYVGSGPNSTNRLYTNQLVESGSTGFTEFIDPLINDPGKARGTIWGSFQDTEAAPQLFQGVFHGENYVLAYNGTNFEDKTTVNLKGDPTAETIGCRMVDYDNDGLLDIYELVRNGQSRMLKNMGNYWFEDRATGDLANGNGVIESAWGDVDNDGDMDVYILRYNEENMLLINDGAGVFSRHTSALLDDSGIGQGACWADYNNDGDLDLFVANWEGPDHLFRNDGNLNFTDVSPAEFANSEFSQSGIWGDYDNDGDLDLFISAMDTEDELWRNEGSDLFTDVSAGPMVNTNKSIGAGWSDYDQDGDLDLFVVNNQGSNQLLQNNTTSSAHWLDVQLVGTRSNATAIGARVTLSTPDGDQYREVGGNHGFWSQPNLQLHFGLGNQTSVLDLQVHWPSGLVSNHTVGAVDQAITIVEPNDWIDLAPGTALGNHYSSTGVAWGDFDSDGDQDVYVVGAGAGSPNALFVNNGEGGFEECTPAILADTGNGTDATWGDVDNDGDLDLFLANALTPNRLFINQGNGVSCWNFSEVFDEDINNTGFATAAVFVDYDHDGSLDLFVSNNDQDNQLLIQSDGLWQDAGITSLAAPGAAQGCAWADFDGDFDEDLYLSFEGSVDILFEQVSPSVFEPIIMPGELTGQGCSWADFDNDGDLDIYTTCWGPGNTLWRNDGEGVFSPVVSLILNNIRSGQSAVWGDYDNDGYQDLYLANYDSPNRLFHNEGGTGEFTIVPNNFLQDKGNGIGAAWSDVDADGRLDLFAGNVNGDNRLFKNEMETGNSWLEVRLEPFGNGTQTNGAAIGAIIKVEAGGMTLIRRVSGGSGYSSQSSLVQHFGLGGATQVDRVTVYWPLDIGGGAHHTTQLEYLAVNQVLTLNELSVPPSGVDEGDTPLAFKLNPCHPNPFNPMTTISYVLPRATTVDLAIFDMTGHLVRVLKRGESESAGLHEIVWQGEDSNGRIVASGVYLYRLRAGEFEGARRMVLMK